MSDPHRGNPTFPNVLGPCDATLPPHEPRQRQERVLTDEQQCAQSCIYRNQVIKPNVTHPHSADHPGRVDPAATPSPRHPQPAPGRRSPVSRPGPPRPQ
jgi:hypothetical protein